jgi:hypothetical protein
MTHNSDASTILEERTKPKSYVPYRYYSSVFDVPEYAGKFVVRDIESGKVLHVCASEKAAITFLTKEGMRDKTRYAIDLVPGD